VEAPLIPVCKEPVPKRGGGLLSRIFCTGLISGTNGPLEPVLMSIFRLVGGDSASITNSSGFDCVPIMSRGLARWLGWIDVSRQWWTF
jgi:hypothetical protein